MPDFNPPIRDLVSLLADSVQRYASRPLLGEKRDGRWIWTTYAEFARKVDACRAGLAALGVRSGDRVAIISGNCVAWAVGAYASYGLGAIYVPMYEAQQEQERIYILQNSEARVCLAATPAIARRLVELKPSLPALEHVICIGAAESEQGSFAALLAAGSRSPRPAEVPDPAQIAGIIYTAGTTGAPKGVVLSHSNIASDVAAGLAIFDLRPDDRSVAFLPWAHLFGQTVELHFIIGTGASTAICEGLPRLMDNLLEVRPTLLVTVPAVFVRLYMAVRRKLAESPAPLRKLFDSAMRALSKRRQGEELSLGERLVVALARRFVFARVLRQFGGRLRFAICGGAALVKEVAEFVDDLGIVVCEGYGLTETSPGACLNTPADRRLGSVGKPVPGVTAALDESAGVEPGEGEIILHGPIVMQGYYKLPEETAKVLLPDGGFRTGDLGRIDQDGFVYVTGRAKELYKLDNGRYVVPGALEEELGLSPYIAQVMVCGANRPFNVAVVVPEVDALANWASAEGIDVSTPERLVEDPRVGAFMDKEIDARSAKFKAFERIRGLVLTAEPFTVANDLLTPKLSIKRRNVVRRYRNEIDALYATQPPERPAGPAIEAAEVSVLGPDIVTAHRRT